MAAGPVVSFRPTKEERELIARTQRKRKLGSPAAAVRYLMRRGALPSRKPGSAADFPLLRVKAPASFRLKRSLRSDEIDEFLYGRKP